MLQIESVNMSATNEETYSDIFKYLNQHLYISNNEILISDPVRDMYIVKHKAPVFLDDTSNLTTISKFILQRDFDFNTTVFDDHELFYAKHQIIEKNLNPKKETSIINVFYPWGYGYYHFLTEVLPNILEINLSHDILLNYCTFAEPIIQWFDISNNLIYNVDKRQYKSELIQPIVECGVPSLRKIQLLRTVIERKLTLKSEIGILIFRREILRQILNLKGTFEMLKEVFPTIEWFIFDTMSIDKTADLFSKAKIIFAAHGAGLTNSIFSPTGTVIYELMPAEKPNLCYYHLSEMLGHKHYIIPHSTNVNQQFAVNTARVSKLIKESLNIEV